MKTINIINTLFASALLTGTLVSCDSDVFNINADPFKGATYTNGTSSPISIYLESEPDFSEYVKALRYSKTFSALNQSTTGVSFTAFVPNNEAMQDFYARRGVSDLEALDPSYVRDFVLYHTLKDSIATSDFVLKESVKNLLGDNLSIVIDPDNAGEANIGSEGHIIEMGISAYNGTIYVLSKALTPLVETVYDRMAESTTSFIMKDAIDESGWKEDLSIVADTTVELGVTTVTNRYYTFFDVTDQTFGKAGIHNLGDLKAKLSELDERGLSDAELLREYVGYHIIKNSMKMSDFGNVEGEEVQTKLFGTCAANQTIMLTIDPMAADMKGMYVFNADGAGASFETLSSDIRATNGYVHTLDSWMPVWQPEQVEVLWDVADNTDIRSKVEQSEDMTYQPAVAPTSNSSIRLVDPAGFTVESNGGAKGSTLSQLNYFVYAPFTLSKNEYLYANNNDGIAFNIGYLGSVVLKTPTLVKGKYRVDLTIIATTDHKSIIDIKNGSNGGHLRLSIDDNDPISSYPYVSVPSNYKGGGPHTVTIFDEVEFTETSDHDFKMVVMDPAASSLKSFSIMIDCIRFIPIK